MPRPLPVTTKPVGKVGVALRAWRGSYILRNGLQMFLAWLGLALLSARAEPWSGLDLACLAVLIVCSLWRG